MYENMHSQKNTEISKWMCPRAIFTLKYWVEFLHKTCVIVKTSGFIARSLPMKISLGIYETMCRSSRGVRTPKHGGPAQTIAQPTLERLAFLLLAQYNKGQSGSSGSTGRWWHTTSQKTIKKLKKKYIYSKMCPWKSVNYRFLYWGFQSLRFWLNWDDELILIIIIYFFT